MQTTNIWMTDKWRDKKISNEFLHDIQVLGEHVAADYKKLGLNVKLWIDDGCLKLSAGVDTPTLGFIEANRLFSVHFGSIKAYCSGTIAKHLVTIFEIFLLLEKYGYADRIEAFRHPYDNQLDVETNAQTDLMNLELI